MHAGRYSVTPLRVELITGRIAAKWQTAGIKFTHRPKISIFALQGRLVAPVYVKFGMAEGNVDPLGRVKFHVDLMAMCSMVTSPSFLFMQF